MTIINSPKIKLGLNAEHPLVKGDVLYDLLKNFFGYLQDNVAPNLQEANIEGSPVLTTQQAGKNLSSAVKIANEALTEIQSEFNFTQ